MEHLDLTYQQFLAFLRLAVGREADSVLMAYDIDWTVVYQIAKHQSVVGVFICGVERFVSMNKKAVLGPPMGNGSLPVALFMDWLGQLEKIKTKNSVVDEATREVLADFETMGCRATILKGQANAHLYEASPQPPPIGKGEKPLPNPLLKEMEINRTKKKGMWLGDYRTSGDIDIWAVKEGMTLDESRKVMARMALEKMPEACVQPHHVDYLKKDGVAVELHFTPSPVYNPYYNRKAQVYFEKVLEERYEEFPVVDGIRRLPMDVDFVFQLMHLRRHLIAEGVGMKQVMDLYFVFCNLSSSERKTAKDTLRTLGLKNFAEAMMWVLGECLGLSEDEMICQPDVKRGRFILDEIIKGGNFGRYDTERGDDGETKWSHLVYHTRLAWRCLRYFPSEAFWNPFYRLGVGVWRKKIVKD